MKKMRDIVRSNLRRLRRERGLTAKDIADVLYIKANTVYKMERGIHSITPEYIDDLCKHYKLDHNYFFFDPDNIDSEFDDIPPELLFSLRKAKDLPLEARRSVVDFIKFQIEKTDEEKERKERRRRDTAEN